MNKNELETISKIQFGVIGLGYWGPNLLRTINSNPYCNLKTAVDVDSNKLRHFQKIYEETIFVNDLEQCLKDEFIDYIIVATPPETHFEIAKKCLQSKKNILVTKPLCLNLSESKTLLEISKINDSNIFIDETFIFSNQVIELKKLINNKNEFGDLTFINSNRVNLGLFQQNTSVLWDLAPHDIAISSYILDEYPDKVRCTAVNPFSNKDLYESYANCEYHFSKKGVIFTSQISWLSPVKSRRMIFGGTKQTIIYDHLDLEAPLKVFNQQILTETNDGITNYDYVVGGQFIPKINIKEALVNEIDEIVSFHNNGAPIFSNGEHGVNSVSILSSLEESSKNGGRLTEVELIN